MRDLQPEQLAHEPAQPLEADMMTVVEVQKKRVDARRERRARRHARGRLGPEPAAATGAAPAQELDPRGVRHDRRDVDMVVTPAHLLDLPGDVRSTLATGVGPAPQRLVRVLRQPSRRPGARGPRCLLVALARPIGLGPEDGGRCEFFEVFFGADSLASSSAIRASHRLDQRRLIIEKRIRLGIAQSVSRPLGHPYVDSHPRVARNTFPPTP